MFEKRKKSRKVGKNMGKCGEGWAKLRNDAFFSSVFQITLSKQIQTVIFPSLTPDFLQSLSSQR